MSFTSRKPARTYAEKLENRIMDLEVQLKIINATYTGLPLFDLETNPPATPSNGDVCLNWYEDGEPYYYYDGEWRPFAGMITIPHKHVSVSGDNATVIKASKGYVGGWFLGNDLTVAVYVKLYDKATAPSSADTPVKVMRIPKLSSANVPASGKLRFLNGISFRIVKGSADNDNTGVGVGEVQVNTDYR